MADESYGAAESEAPIPAPVSLTVVNKDNRATEVDRTQEVQYPKVRTREERRHPIDATPMGSLRRITDGSDHDEYTPHRRV